jgi:6-phospho-3-hexuloisomerase
MSTDVWSPLPSRNCARLATETKGGAISNLYQAALADLAAVFARLDDAVVEAAVDEIAAARRVALYGCGREGLQMRGFCMRLFHLGRHVAMVGDMTTFPVGPGDLLFASAGPGELATASALIGVAKQAGARTMLITAQPHGATSRLADRLLVLPGQTMADDQEPATAVLPMGSVFEGAQFILFEVMLLKLRERLGVTPEAMRANHTNLE